MSSEQPNQENIPVFGGSQSIGGTQPQSEMRPEYENNGASLPTFSASLQSQTPQNMYNPQLNQSSTDPNLGQAQISPTNNNYMTNSNPLMGSGMGNQYQQPSGQVMGQNQMPSNQPPIGQSSYQSYPQQNYSQPMSNVVPMSNSSPPGGQMGTNLPSVGMNTAPPYQSSQGENTYEPGMPNPYSSSAGHTMGHDSGIPLSSDGMKEFQEHLIRCKTYKQSDIFAATLLKNEEDGIRVIEYYKAKGVSLCSKDTLEQSALFYACRDGKARITQMLLDNGCQPNDRD